MAKDNQGDGAFIDFGEIQKRTNAPDKPTSKNLDRRADRVVAIAWLLAASLIISLVVITLLSRGLNRASHKIDEQNKMIEDLKLKIETLSRSVR